MKYGKMILVGLNIFSLIFFTVGAFMLYNTDKFLKEGIKTNANVTDYAEKYDYDSSSTMYTPILTYKTETGEEITAKSTVSASFKRYDINEQVEIYYMPENPEKFTVNTFFELWLFGIIFTGIGLLMLIGVNVAFAIKHLNYKKREQLYFSGQKVEAKILNFNKNTSYNIQNKNPYMITASWTDPADNKPYLFTSELIWDDPTPYLQNRENIDVYIDPSNPRKYIIDTRFIMGTQ